MVTVSALSGSTGIYRLVPVVCISVASLPTVDLVNSYSLAGSFFNEKTVKM